MGDDNPRAFKHWFSTTRVHELADRLAHLERRFDRAAFIAATRGLETLELKARVALIADALHVALPISFPEVAFRDVSIRKHHPGEHVIEVLVNGKALGTARIDLA